MRYFQRVLTAGNDFKNKAKQIAKASAGVVLLSIFLSGLLLFPFAVMTVADNAHSQRIAGVYYGNSDTVEHAVAAVDPAFDLPLNILVDYNWYVSPEDIDESLVVTELRKSGAVVPDERFSSLWDYMGYYELFDKPAVNNAYIKWLSLENPHRSNDNVDVFDEYFEESKEKRMVSIQLDFSRYEIQPADETDNIVDDNEIINANTSQLFRFVHDHLMASADVYMANGRFIDAQNYVKRAAQWIRTYDLAFESAYENPANEVYILEILLENLDYVLANAKEAQKLYRQIREMNWASVGKGPWWDEEAVPYTELPILADGAFEAFRCQQTYLRSAYLTRTGSHQSAMEVLADLNPKYCLNFPLLLEWSKFLQLQIQASIIFDNSCIALADREPICGEGAINRDFFEATKKNILNKYAKIKISRNSNLDNDIAQLVALVKDASYYEETSKSKEEYCNGKIC